MGTKLFVVTGENILDTGKVSFGFMMKKPIPFTQFADIAKTFGWLRLRKKGSDEVDLFKLARREPNAIGDDGVKKWEVFIFESNRGQIMTCSTEESPGNEAGLKKLIEELPSCVLLMHRSLFDRFAEACAGMPNITLDFYHYQGELATA